MEVVKIKEGEGNNEIRLKAAVILPVWKDMKYLLELWLYIACENEIGSSLIPKSYSCSCKYTK